jgi:hypothetical protein
MYSNILRHGYTSELAAEEDRDNLIWIRVVSFFIRQRNSTRINSKFIHSEDQVWFTIGYRLFKRLTEVTKDMSIELCETLFSRSTNCLSGDFSESFELCCYMTFVKKLISFLFR